MDILALAILNGLVLIQDWVRETVGRGGQGAPKLQVAGSLTTSACL